MNWRFILYFVLALLVIQIPFAGTFFQMANTLVHESAHALITLLFRGEVYEIQLFSDTSGTTHIGTYSGTALILSSLAGYVGSSCFALLLANLTTGGKHASVLWIFVILSVINLTLWVRNPFGMLWLVAFLVLLLFVLFRKTDWLAALSIWLFMFVLAESISSSFVVMLAGFFQPESAGDATNLARNTPLSAGFWGVLFMVQALFFGLLSAKTAFFKRPREQSRNASAREFYRP